MELRDAQSGETVAKFDPMKTKEIEIAGRKYEVVPLLPVAARKAQTIRIPKLEFRDATLKEAIQALQREPDEAEGWKRPFNIVLLDEELGSRQFTLSMRDATFASILKTIAEMVHCKIVYGDDTVSFFRSGAAK